MPAFDVLDALVRGGNGVLRTADAVAAGIARPVLGNYVRERGLERVGHGLYLAPEPGRMGCTCSTCAVRRPCFPMIPLFSSTT